MENVYIMNHPLIQHKISMLRNKNTGTNEFRKLVEEIGILMGYEALRDLPVENVEVETPIETCMTPMISGKKLAVIPVLRAGLGMVNSILTLVPSAKVGHVGLYRDPVTHEPHEYYCKLPEAIDERISVIVDPMLATGGSAEAAVDFVKKQGGKNIKFMCIIAAPEGLKRLHEAHPDVQIYCGHLDRELNDHAYICPGLGDAGDGQGQLHIGQHRLMRDEVVALEHEADGVVAVGVPVPVSVAASGDAVDDKFAAVVTVKAADDVEQGGLARAAGAEDGNKFTVAEVEADPVERCLCQIAGGVFLFDVDKLKHWPAFPAAGRGASAAYSARRLWTERENVVSV